MKIVKPYARLDAGVQGINSPDEPFTLAMGIKLLKVIEYEARKSHASNDKMTEDSWERFVKFVVIDKGDWSVVEHATVQVDSLTDRGISHEWVRHRLMSFTQESTRFVRYFKEKEDDVLNPAKFIYPNPAVECEYCLAGSQIDVYNNAVPVHAVGSGNLPCSYHLYWVDAIEMAENKYRALLKEGWRPQEARSVLPNALSTRIGTTSNLRNWRHVLIMRTTLEAHPQYRQIAIPLLKEFQAKIPILFDDIVPNEKQSEAIKKAR